jgi:hypothetical protein
MEIAKNITKMKQNYWHPTPKKWRKLGDALLAVSTAITGFALYENVKWVALTALITGVIGKFLTNFFTEEEVQVNRRGRKPKNP